MSDNTDARKALRDFYKLQAAAAAKAAPEEPVEQATPEPATQSDHAVIDDPATNIDDWVKEKLDTCDIVDLLKTHAQLLKEQAAFSSEERELVNDNYKKLIQAAETLEYLSAQGALAGLDDLSSSIDLIAEIVGAEPPKKPSDPSTFLAFAESREAYLQKYPIAESPL